MGRVREKNQKTVTTAMLAALVVVLQIICTFVKFGPFSITLALTPIIIGAAIYGAGTGAFLGGVFGAVVFVTGLFGWDGGFIQLMLQYSVIGTIIMCFVKSIVAGAFGAIIYRIFAKKSDMAASIIAGAVVPITNTGIFAAGMLTIFNGFVNNMAQSGGENVLSMLFLGWIGINFVIELITNLILATATSRIVKYFTRKRSI